MKDIDEIRRDNLRLIEDECGGSASAANRAGMSPAQFINLRNGAKDSKTGKPRGMRKETARRIETAFSKPTGWLDVDRSKPSPAKTPPQDHKSFSDIQRRYQSASESKKAVVDLILSEQGEYSPGWVDSDARAYIDSLEAKALKWISSDERNEPKTKNTA